MTLFWTIANWCDKSYQVIDKKETAYNRNIKEINKYYSNGFISEKQRNSLLKINDRLNCKYS